MAFYSIEQIQKELDVIIEGVLKTVPAVAIYLFGSYANGTSDEHSDIDIYVVVPDIDIDLVNLCGDIRMNLRNKKNMPLDLLAGKASVFNSRKQGLTLENLIVREGVLLHGQ